MLRNKYAPPKVRCPCCKTGLFATYGELAKHILETDDDVHKNARVWAKRWADQIDKINAAVEGREPICSICHLPIGKQDQNHCCC